jgi:hypothetical protein
MTESILVTCGLVVLVLAILFVPKWGTTHRPVLLNPAFSHSASLTRRLAADGLANVQPDFCEPIWRAKTKGCPSFPPPPRRDRAVGATSGQSAQGHLEAQQVREESSCYASLHLVTSGSLSSAARLFLGPEPLRHAKRLASSKPTFPELLFGALGVPDVARGFPVRPALFPRFTQAARG